MSLKSKLLLPLAVLLLAGWMAYHLEFPFGARTCFLPCTTMALVLYSQDHQGWFPRNTNSYADCLLELYPKYLSNPDLLAGISGDRKKMRDLVIGKPTSLGTNETSWVYIPGFRNDDSPPVAILWENREGLQFNGKRRSGHAVGMSDGSHRQVLRNQWQGFSQEQAKLRARILSLREK